MAIVKKTYSDLIRLSNVINAYLEKNKDAENKICASVKLVKKQLPKAFDEFNDLRDTAQINNCAVDEKGIIVKNEKGERQFTPAGEIKLKSDLKDLLNTEVELHSRISEGIEDLIPALTDDEKELISELVIPKVEVQEENE